MCCQFDEINFRLRDDKMYLIHIMLSCSHVNLTDSEPNIVPPLQVHCVAGAARELLRPAHRLVQTSLFHKPVRVNVYAANIELSLFAKCFVCIGFLHPQIHMMQSLVGRQLFSLLALRLS